MSKESEEIEKSVDAYINRKNIKFEAFNNGVKRTQLDNGGTNQQDAWRVVFSNKFGKLINYSFDFYTGTGLRILPKMYRKNSLHKWPTLTSESQLRENVGIPVPPNATCVLQCLVLDSGAMDMCFSDWCDECGYDSDSLKARNIYDTCCDNGKMMRACFGRDGLQKLAELTQDY